MVFESFKRLLGLSWLTSNYSKRETRQPCVRWKKANFKKRPAFMTRTTTTSIAFPLLLLYWLAFFWPWDLNKKGKESTHKCGSFPIPDLSSSTGMELRRRRRRRSQKRKKLCWKLLFDHQSFVLLLFPCCHVQN